MNWTGFLKSKAHWWLFTAAAFIAFFHCLALGQAYSMGDLLAQFGPWRAFLKNQLAAGHFPLWNPYYFGGLPFFADLQNELLYPLNWLTLPFSLPYGLSVYFFLHMVVAALGMHGWLKSLRLPEAACRLFALVYALSGFFWWELIHLTILGAFAWFPALMWALERLAQRPSPSRAFPVGLAAAAIFLCGNFQLTSCFYYTGPLYFLGRLFIGGGPSEGEPRRWTWKKAAGILLFGLWGAFPLFLQLAPTYQFANLSDRTESSLGYDNFNSQFSLQPQSLYQLFFPTLGVPPGRTIEQCLAPVTVDIAYMGVYGFLGVWVPLLAFQAFRRKDRKLLYFFLAFAVLSLLTALGKYFPLHRILCQVLPTLSLSRVPARYIAVYDAFTTLLAAFGYQALERTLSEKERPSSGGPVLAGLIYAFFLFLLAFLRPDESWPEIIALALGSAGLALWGFTQSWRSLGRWTFQAALIVPLFLNGWSAAYGWGSASNYDWESRFPAFSYLKEHAKDCRYYFDPQLSYPQERQGREYLEGFPVDSPMAEGVRMSNGYNPMSLKSTSQVEKLPMGAFLRLMAIRGLLFGQDRGEAKEFTRMSFQGSYLYEINEPHPYVNAPSQITVVPDDSQRLAALGAPGFNPADQAVLSEALPSNIASQLDGQKAQLTYDHTLDEPNREAFQVRLDKNSLVVFSEVMFPGWRAYLDGQSVPLFTADHVFRAVVVPAGGHTVEFDYQPVWAKPCLVAGLLWILSVAGLGVWRMRAGKGAVEAAQA